MKVSWNECTQFAAQAGSFLARTKDRETKLSYAIKRVVSRIQKQQATVNEAIADIEIDHCLTENRNGSEVIVRDGQGNLQYTKEGIKARNTAQAKYISEANVEIEPYFATKLPDDLTVFEIEAFAGFVIDKEDAERLLRECETRGDALMEPSGNGHLVDALVTASV